MWYDILLEVFKKRDVVTPGHLLGLTGPAIYCVHVMIIKVVGCYIYSGRAGDYKSM